MLLNNLHQPRLVLYNHKRPGVRLACRLRNFSVLENTVKEIQSGARPAPKPRRGCRSLFMQKQIGVVDQTPTEITIYAQVQPIYAEYYSPA